MERRLRRERAWHGLREGHELRNESAWPEESAWIDESETDLRVQSSGERKIASNEERQRVSEIETESERRLKEVARTDE